MTHTRGNIIIENIKAGDVHYEFEYNLCLKVTVLTTPLLNGDTWSWISEDGRGKQIDYVVTKGYSHYAPKLYDYIAYKGCKEI